MKGSAVRIRASAPRKARMSRLFSRLVSRLLLGLAGESLAAASGRLGAPGPAACLAARAVLLECLGRPEEEVDERPQERREPEQGRDADEPAVVDAPARVAEDPPGEAEPEDDHEEDRDVAGDLERGRLEEVVHRREGRE